MTVTSSVRAMLAFAFVSAAASTLVGQAVAGTSITAARSLCKAAVAEQIAPAPASTRFLDEGLSVNADRIKIRVKLTSADQQKSEAVCVVDRATSKAAILADGTATVLVER